MEIDYNFSIYGFEKKNYGLGGVVLERWERPKTEKREATIREDSYYGGYGAGEYQNFRISIPKPLAKVLTGTVMITRQSKNRYSLAMQNGKLVRIVPLVTSLTAIRELVNEFFEGEEK